MFCQFVLMPVFSYFLGWLLLPTKYERLGLLMLGCSPGGANSNFWVETSDQSYQTLTPSFGLFVSFLGSSQSDLVNITSRQLSTLITADGDV